MKTWSLQDVEVTANEHPKSFFIPSLAERCSRKPGEQVRLHFLLNDPGEEEPSAERMWVEIAEASEDSKHYRGELTNQPAYIKGLNIGDTIEFEPRHIAQTILKKGDPRWIECSELGALVSAKVFEDGGVIRFAYREEADNERDSGWRLFTGLETDEYTNNAGNIRICNVNWLVDLDPTLAEIFKAEAGSVFERAERSAKWETLTDWEPSEE